MFYLLISTLEPYEDEIFFESFDVKFYIFYNSINNFLKKAVDQFYQENS
jgi:hypothetical protein